MSELNNDLVPIYTEMIAGSFPKGERVDPQHSVSLICSDVLSTPLVHMLISESEGMVHYLAVPSKLLASKGKFSTPLAAAFPGHPDYKGDGAYVYYFQPYAAAVIRRGSATRLLFSFSREIDDTLGGENLPVIEVTDASAREMRSQSWLYMSLASRSVKVANVLSVAVLLVSGVLILASNGVAGYLSADVARSNKAIADEANTVIASTRLNQPLTNQMERITALSATIVKTGGWLDGYQYDRASGEKFVISLPGWATADVIQDLGEGVRTELQKSDNLIWVTKKDNKGNSIKGQGPAEIPTDAPSASASSLPKAEVANKGAAK